MSQQAGPSTSTGGDQASQQQQTQQQTQQNPFPSTLDFSTQQQLLQQFAAKFPNNLAQLGQGGGGAANPAALFPNLPNLTLPPNRKSSGGSLGGAGSPASNGSTTAPSLNLNLAAAAASALPGTTPGQVDVQALQAQLQARMLQVQQQALQAAAMRAGGAPGSSPAATAGSPANAQASTPGSTTAVQDPTAAAPVRPVNGIPDWAAQAAASGLLGNIAAGADREAILKQSQAQRAKHAAALGGAGVNAATVAAAAAASPASVTAPSPAAASATAPSPAPNATGTPVSGNPILPSAASPASAPSPSVIAAVASAAGIRPPLGASPATPVGGGLAGPGAPGARPPGMPVRPMLQKQQLLNSLVQYYKTVNQPMPTELVNGSFKLGETWIELTELFFAIFRQGGLMKIIRDFPGNPTESPVWQQLLTAKGVPSPLPAPVTLPRQDPSSPAQTTTNPVQYLLEAYRAWIFGFEQAMARSKMAQIQKQQQAALAASGGVRPPLAAGSPVAPTPPGGPMAAPSPQTVGTPRAVSGPAPSAPTPTAIAPSPQASIPPASPAVAAPSPAVQAIAATPSPAVATPSPTAVVAPPAVPDVTPAQPVAPAATAATPTASAPTPIAPTSAAPTPVAAPAANTPSPATPVAAPKPKIDIAVATAAAGSPLSAVAPIGINGTPTTADGGPAKKRKRDLANNNKSASPSTPAPISAPQSAVPHVPKRQRYKVEYRPLHFPQPTLGGWDERAVASAFPKHLLGRPTHASQELKVDVEAVLMGLRSRLPREVGYGLTVLSMLSMPQNDAATTSLPILPMIEVYNELLDLIAEAALGDGGLEAWLKEQAQAADGTTTPRASVPPLVADLRLTFGDLEQLGHHFDYSVSENEDSLNTGREQTRGPTDIVLAGLNIIRNFSFLPENQQHMARPELFNLLAAITSTTLARLPGEPDSAKPYSVLELARVRRESVAILTNLGGFFDLRAIPSRSVLSIFQLIAGFLTEGWESFRLREPGYGPNISIRDVPPTAILSVDRALEAFGRLALLDHNREVIASVVPADELVGLFAGLIKLFPLSKRDLEAMHSIEDYLGRVELVALAVYSLAFLAPQGARTGMRSTPGATAVLTRLVHDLTPRAPELKTSPFGILVRRVAETLGVLNGTVNAGGNSERMSFSAGGVDGKGWKFASDSVEPGWLAYDAERVLESMGWGSGRGPMFRVDGPTFAELDGLWRG
ncbi:uncharacterized protein LOC62_01G000677 [Vanrija pseudolonga]|uniref:ARID domain-containing protein n=1 Tax=Vanrija pseudolonga TaxID=143232 RepID=A0AAF1BEU6_9TREE|nr:hypothetical protein LOC62_01G000677 [Vanrija pseudolonga]